MTVAILSGTVPGYLQDVLNKMVVCYEPLLECQIETYLINFQHILTNYKVIKN